MHDFSLMSLTMFLKHLIVKNDIISGSTQTESDRHCGALGSQAQKKLFTKQTTQNVDGRERERKDTQQSS